MHRDEAVQVVQVLDVLIELAQISIIYSNFITTFVSNAVLKPDGSYYLHGNYKLGGTVSGRLASSNVNLQNLPSSGSKYAKAVKKCFINPPKWLFVGADFNSLEDRISALTTKDPEKLKVYTDGFDGHCLRAYTYFKEDMPLIEQALDTDTCYKVTVEGEDHYIKAGTLVHTPDGDMLIEQFYKEP